MADYYQVKNQNIFNPPANTFLGNTTNQYNSVYVQNDLVLGNVTVTGSTIIAPRITTIAYPGDDTAADTAGGQTITLTGSGFVAGASVLINGSAVGVVSVVSSTSITFTSPANATGSYVIYVINSDGSTAIAIPGIQYSGTPTWTTSAGTLGNVYETASFTQTVTATGDAPITYSVFSGSIPPGSTFNANGTITGTSQLSASPTTYSFTVRATDAQLQDTNRAFSISVIPDVVTWSNPTNNTTYTQAANVAIANITLSATSAVGSGITYSANTLPTGLSLTGANISGTPTVSASTSSLLTATANTTSESSSITINWSVSVASDPYFMYNSLLLPGNGTNGAQNNTFLDDSTNNFAITRNGNTTQGTFSPYGANWSNYFDGTGDTVAAGYQASLILGTVDFTVECWINPGSQPGAYNTIIGGDTSGAMLLSLVGSGTSTGVSVNAYGSQPFYNQSYTFTQGVWYHIAVTRSGTNLKVFINGTQLGSTVTDSTNFSSATHMIGGAGNNNQTYSGYVSNARIVKNTAVYTSNFTPSTTPLTAITNTQLLTCQSNRFIDNSTNAFAITVVGNTNIQRFSPFNPSIVTATSYSGYFDGTGDYLTAPNNAAFNLSSGDWTIEGWFYFNALVTGSTLFSIQPTSGSTYSVYLNGTSGQIDISLVGSSTITMAASGSIAVGSWYHIAFVKTSTSTITCYVNGVTKNNTTSYTFSNSNSSFYIGENPIYSGVMSNGYISNLRVVKGVAVYTGAFTVPTTPLQATQSSGTNIAAITGTATSLLTLQSTTFIDNSTNNFTITAFGNTQPTQQNPFGFTSALTNGYTVSTIGGSGYFDGTGDYLTLTGQNISTSNFTIECWVNYSSFNTTAGHIFSFGTDLNNRYGLYRDPVTGKFEIATVNSGTYTITTGATTVISIGIWYHVAWVKNGATSTLYVNGISQCTNSGSINAGTSWAIGFMQFGSAANDYLTGYISNFRVLNGTALYTSTFTPPTAPLTAIANTALLLNYTNAGIIDNTMMNNLETVGNAQISTAQSKFGGGSMYFDGTGDYLTAGSSISLSGSFTIEGWVYITSTATNTVMFGIGDDSLSTGLSVFVTPAGQPKMLSNDGYPVVGSNGQVGTNQWVHIALVRNSTALTLYVNGTSVGTGTNSSTFSGTSYVGAENYASTIYITAAAYIDDLRITKGYARYTTTFTPPTSAFPTY